MCPIVGIDTPDPLNPISFELRVYDLIDKVEIEGSEPFDPSYYFITSGDAVQKTKAMIRHLKAMVSTADQKHAKIWIKALGQAENMLQMLENVRGSACFLETEWGSDDSVEDTENQPFGYLPDTNNKRRLSVIPKNPRVK